MRQITSRDLHMALKNEATIDDLMNRYGMNTQEELIDAIRKTLPREAQKFIKYMKGNQKRHDRQTREEKAELVLPLNTNSEEETMEESEEKGGDYQTDEACRNKKLGMLREEEAELSEICIELETSHKALVTRKQEILKQLYMVNKTLGELQRLVKVNSEKATALLEEHSEISGEMPKKIAEISLYRQELEVLRGQIEQLNEA